MPKATPISLADAFAQTTFFGRRTPETTDEEAGTAFGRLAEYRDGAIFIANYAGNSEWERHRHGDEIVFVVEGETTLFLLNEDKEDAHAMRTGDLIVVPQNTWHRFETPNGVRALFVTPQPTDHQVERPAAGT
jgi:mannose-6-phosphate isomerase-like protein (cupin superfamily)